MFSLSPTGAALPLRPSAVHISVLRGILMPLRAVSPVGPHMVPVSNLIQRIVRPGAPSKILQPIVQWIGVGVMAALLPWRRRTNKGSKDQPMNLMYLPRSSGQSDTCPAVSDHRFHRLASEPANPPVCVFYGSVQGADVSPVGNLVSTFVSRNREPAFVGHRADYTPAPTTGTHYL